MATNRSSAKKESAEEREMRNLKEVINSNEELICEQSKKIKLIQAQYTEISSAKKQLEAEYSTLVALITPTHEDSKNNQLEETASEDQQQTIKAADIGSMVKRIVQLEGSLAHTKLQLALRSEELILNQFQNNSPRKRRNSQPERYSPNSSSLFFMHKTSNFVGHDEPEDEGSVRQWKKLIETHQPSKIKERAASLIKSSLPHSMRPTLWFLLTQNRLNLTNQLYTMLLERRAKDWVNPKVASQILKDINRSFVGVRQYESRIGLNEEVTELLQLFHLYRPDVSYVQGMTYPAIVLTLILGKIRAFHVFSNIVVGNLFFLKLFTFDGNFVPIVCRGFEILLSEYCPFICNKLQEMKIQSEFYLVEWFYTFFSRSLTLGATLQFWDQLIYYGELATFRLGLSVFELLSERLIRAGYEETMDIVRNYGGHLEEDKLIGCMISHRLTPTKLQHCFEKAEQQLKRQ